MPPIPLLVKALTIHYKLFQSSNQLISPYTGENIVILGSVDVDVSYNDKKFTLPLLVVQGSGPSLFERNWLQQVKLNWTNINAVSFKSKLDTLLEKHVSFIESKSISSR